MSFHFPAQSIRARAGEHLSIFELKQHIPALFAEAAHASRSEKFVPISTTALLTRLDAAGFDVVSAKQGGTRTPGKEAFTRHELRLRHRGTGPRAVNDVIPEIVLGNGNDGTAAYTITAGLFRLVCLNGLTVGVSQFQGFRVAHTGRAAAVLDNVIESTATVVSETARALETVEAWKGRTLTADQGHELATRAAALRWGAAENAPIPPSQLLSVRREADRSNDVWTVFNRVQENVIRGGFDYRIPNQRRNARNHWQHRTVGAVNSIDDDRRINRELWDAVAQIAA